MIIRRFLVSAKKRSIIKCENLYSAKEKLEIVKNSVARICYNPRMNELPIQKYISRSGAYSRRKAEAAVKAGTVSINGVLANMGDTASDADTVIMNGERIVPKKNEYAYVALHKPVGYVCTHASFKNEQSIFDLLPSEFKCLHIAGRLDKDSEGLVLLTDNGEIVNRITHPRYEHEKTYRVHVDGLDLKSPSKIVEQLKKGVDIGDGDGIVRAKRVKYIEPDVLEIVLTEGKKRQIRRMCSVSGLEVRRLIRFAVGVISIKNIPSGKWRQVKKEEIEHF